MLLEVGDESKILPSSLVKCWKEALSLAHSTPQQESARNVLFSDAFLRVFINSCGQYKDFITNGNFQVIKYIALFNYVTVNNNRIL